MSIAKEQHPHEIASPQPHSETAPDWLAIAVALLSLLLLFAWIYGRFAGKLSFVMDDYIEAEAALARPLLAFVSDSFSGALVWSGYRPVADSTRALLAHLFGVDQLTGYYLFILGLHFANTLLTFHLVWRVGRNAAWAYLAAAFVLLLPSHNEAVLYMTSSGNLLALFFALLTLELALAARRSHSWWAQLGAGLTYLLAILASEVTLSLLALILIADWWMERALPRKHWLLYGSLAAGALLALGLRFWAVGGAMTPARADYSISLAPAHLLHGYTVLLAQMTLLFNSPWLHLPDFVWTREWMAPTNPRALVSMGITFVLSAVTLLFGLRRTHPQDKPARALFWVGWGVLWVLLISLPFAALAGRNPENRYTYIPAFGAGIALAALCAWGWHKLAPRRTLAEPLHRPPGRRSGAQVLLLAVAVCVLTFYAWVDTSDVSEWERAAIHARAFLAAARAEASTTDSARVLAQVGVPGDVGSAYVFTTAESFRAAIRLHVGSHFADSVAGDLAVRELLLNAPDDTESILLLGYNRDSATARRVAEAWLCANPADPEGCAQFRLAASDPAVAPAPWLYVQVYNESPADSGLEPGIEAGGIGMLLDRAAAADPASASGALLSCWMFYDVERVAVNPAAFDNAAVRARCQTSADALLPMLSRTRP